MSLPTQNDVQAVDPVLTNMLVGYMQADTRFVADRVFPGVPVDKDSGTYYIFTKKYWFLDEMKHRAYGGQYPRAGFGVETDTYSTLQWALSNPIADETRANSQVPMDLEQAGIRWLAQQNLLRKEIQWAADFMTINVWATDDTTATDWDDYASGDPVSDMLTATTAIGDNTGYEANAMVLGRVVHNALVNHPDIIDRMKHVQVAGIGAVAAGLASIFDIENYIVGKATYSNTNEASAFSKTSILDDDCLVCRITPTPGIFEASAGYTFNWAPGGGLGGMQPLWRDGANDADLLKTKMQWDQKAVATDLGYFFSGIV